MSNAYSMVAYITLSFKHLLLDTKQQQKIQNQKTQLCNLQA